MSSTKDGFDEYAQKMLADEFKGYEVDRFEGTMPCNRRFIIVTSKVLWYAVRLIIEPYKDKSDNYIMPNPAVTREGFFLESAASEYVQELSYELQAKSNSISPRFEQHVAQTLQRYTTDKELYRLRGRNADGKRFAFVFLENVNQELFKVLCITEPASGNQGKHNAELELSKEYTSKFEAETKFHDDFHKRKQLHEKIHYASPSHKSHHGVAILSKFTDKTNFVDINLPEQSATFKNILKSDETPARIFRRFVQKCWTHAISGEEVFRQFRVTKGGQRLAFVVSKHNHYSVLVVLEPDPRYSQRFGEKDAVTAHSFTIRLKKIQTRRMMDSWIEHISKVLFLKKSDLQEKEKPSYLLAAEGRLIPTKGDCVDKPDDYLVRGDHIRRNLKVPTFNLSHHDGIYLGKGKVAHFTPKNGTGAEIVSISKFAKGEKIMIVSYVCRPRSFHEVAQEAERLVKTRTWETRYNVLERNCQVFVRLCLNYTPAKEKKEFADLFLEITEML